MVLRRKDCHSAEEEAVRTASIALEAALAVGTGADMLNDGDG